MWKDWKRRLKANYFTPYKDDPNYDLSHLPNEQIELEQWLYLVKHWKLEEVEKIAKKNSGNRANRKHPHRTGKMPFQLVREEIKKKGIDVTKLDLFMESRSRGKGIDADQETYNLIREIKEELSKRSESELTKEFKEDLFINVFGEEQQGRDRCTGRRINQGKLHGASSLKDQTDDMNAQIKELQQLKEDLVNQKEELAKKSEEHQRELDNMKITMDLYASLLGPGSLQAALSRGSGNDVHEISNALNTHGIEPNFDANTPRTQQSKRFSSSNSIPNEMVGENPREENNTYNCVGVEVGCDVLLYCSEIPKVAVAEGVLLSLDDHEKIDDIALGPDFVKVAVEKGIKLDYLLERPRRGISTIQQAVGKSVAWKFVDVLEK